MYVSINKQLIKFAKLLWHSIWEYQGRVKRHFLILNVSAGNITVLWATCCLPAVGGAGVP